MPKSARTHRSPWLALGAITAMTAGALTLAATGAQQSNDQPRGRTAQMVSAEDLSDDPQKYYGQMVTIRDDVEDVLGANLFTLDDGEFLGVSPNILVFAPDAEATPAEDRTVTITGTVRQYTEADLRRDYGWGWGGHPWGAGYYGYPWYGPEYGPDYFVRFQNRPVIVASSVMTESGRQLIPQNTANRSETVGTSGTNTSADETITTLSALTSGSAAQLDGRDVRLSAVAVDRVSGRRGFWTTTPNGQHLFVALDEDIRELNLQKGQTVTIAGEVEKAPRDAKTVNAKEWNLSSEDVNQLMKTGVFVHATALMPSQG